MKLFMLLLGCTPAGRNIEQHDMFFGIAATLSDLVPEIIQTWPEAEGDIHIDAWRHVNYVDQYKVDIFHKPRLPLDIEKETVKLFFLNLGGYRQHEFEEYHYKMLVAAANKSVAIRVAKATAFYKHTGFKGAESHIDDKYGVDVDDVFEIEDILPRHTREKYGIRLSPVNSDAEDELHLGYFKLEKL